MQSKDDIKIICISPNNFFYPNTPNQSAKNIEKLPTPSYQNTTKLPRQTDEYTKILLDTVALKRKKREFICFETLKPGEKIYRLNRVTPPNNYTENIMWIYNEDISESVKIGELGVIKPQF